MRNVRCNLSGSVVEISFGSFRRELTKGSVVDLDQVVGRTKDVKNADGQVVDPARDVRVEDLLQGRLECFSPVEPESDQQESSASPAAADDVQE